ncbi:DUF6602 domain-containing protein [Vibrio aestuarianus]|uniref:DUF6602 domain-containing protein n=1 Tax=Vibrio aestuarianus TaxID=28171 RepID=UPI00237D0247|nr:DUF6602 domain-containing protein [Vibrio aestuarianus]MDE1334175.1 hypothetical protein [Vibrio aestuarianus]
MRNISEDKDKLKDLQTPSGTCAIIQDGDGVYQKVYLDDDNFLADRFHRKIKSEMEWFEKIIKHSPTVGSFYENLLRTTLKEFAPANNCIGTGFVFDSTRKKHGKQIDVLVYDDSDRSVIYRCDEFVVIHPSSVISTIEVKKTLNSTVLKEVVKSTFYNNLGQEPLNLDKVQSIKIFSYKLQCRRETICKALVSALEGCIESLEVSCDGRNGHIPITYCSLPSLYFLDEPFYITTNLVKNGDSTFSIVASVHDTKGSGSIGALLESAIQENKHKVLEHEKSYLQNVLRKPPETIEIKGNISLVDDVSYRDFINAFPEHRAELSTLELNGFKPTSLMLPKGTDLSEYTDPNTFFSSVKAGFEMYKYDADSPESTLVSAENFKI